MRFLTGNAGIVVVIVAIMGTVAVGYILAGDTETETVTEFQHTADITGLFATSNEPEYLDYSPPENWTGWRTGNYYMQGVDYEQSERATPYIVPQQDRTETYSGTVTGNDNPYATSYLFFGSWGSGTQATNPKLVSLASVIEGLNLADDIVTLDIWTASGGPILTGYSEYFPSTPAPTFQRYLATDPDTRHVIVHLNDTNQRTVLYDSTGKATNVLALSNVGVFYGSDLNLTDAFTYQGTRDLPIIYMDATQGVMIDRATVDWSTGYTIAGLTVAFEGPGSAQLRFTVDGIGNTVNVSPTAILVNGQAAFQLHSWTHFALRFDFLSGTVELLTIADWTDFLTWTGIPSGKAQFYGTGTITQLVFNQIAGDNARLGITDTIVYMDTSKVVLKDPSITITDYWPEDDARVQFNGFAMYGDSLTMNGQTYAVDDGQITIGGRSVELSNLTITWLDGRATAQIGQTTYDLGETTDHTVSFGGIWYFAASYWGAQEVTKEIYNWTTGIFGMGGQATILVYIGLLFAGTAILHRAQGLHGGDLLIIACAGVVGYVLLDMMA